MSSTWNSTKTEIIEWAYSDDASIEQDWDLAIATAENYDTILMLASDQNCPNKQFFLHCLYLIIGDGVRSNWTSQSKEDAEKLIKTGYNSANAQVRFWSKDADKLIENPHTFNYQLWCDGELANANDSQVKQNNVN